MAAKIVKAAFMNGVQYRDRQQYRGESLGGMHMINRRLKFGKGLYSKDLYAHYGCVNAVEFSNDGEWLVSGGDDKRVLVWNVDKTLASSYQPKVMKGEHNSNIFCLGFNSSHTKLYSAGNDEQVILHDVKTAEVIDVFLHDEAVYGLSVDPLDENIFVSACDDGRVLMWDIRQSYSDACTIARCSSAYHAVMHHPIEPHYVATANAKDGVCLWDIRKPRVNLMTYGPKDNSQSAMSVRFNYSGTHILALRRRLPPVLYDAVSGQTVVEFDHPEYYNSCTMKSCCFAGEKDQYVLSGSDDFKLYVWKIPDVLAFKKRFFVTKADFVLRGHRSIVNQVRYNNSYGILASSGVEKIVKIWSSFPISQNDIVDGYVSEKDLNRKVYSHEEYINLVLESGQFMTHDYSHHSVQEDPRMMAFFDSLVQRDIEGWSSDASEGMDVFATRFEVRSSSSSSLSSSSSSSSSDSDDGEPGSERLWDGGTNILSAYQNAQVPNPVTLTFPSVSSRNAKKSKTVEKIDFSIDRISQLIAEKRQMANKPHKHSRPLVFRRKHKAVMKALSSKITNASATQQDSSATEQEGSAAELGDIFAASNDDSTATSSAAANLKDKRKLLNKKRAKITKEASLLLDSSSSDSEASSENDVISNCNTENENNVKNTDTGAKTSEIDDSNVSENGDTEISENADTKNSEHDDTKISENTNINFSENVDMKVSDNSDVKMTENDIIKEESDTLKMTEDVNNPDDSEINDAVGTDKSANKECNDIDPLPNGSSNGLNGSTTSTNSIVFFPSKNGKHNKRNYRKRSAEEMDDD